MKHFTPLLGENINPVQNIHTRTQFTVLWFVIINLLLRHLWLIIVLVSEVGCGAMIKEVEDEIIGDDNGSVNEGMEY